MAPGTDGDGEGVRAEEDPPDDPDSSEYTCLEPGGRLNTHTNASLVPAFSSLCSLSTTLAQPKRSVPQPQITVPGLRLATGRREEDGDQLPYNPRSRRAVPPKRHIQ